MSLELALKALAVVALAVLLLTAYLYFTQRELYFPWPDVPAAPPPGVQDIELQTDDGPRLGAWLIPAADQSGRATGPGQPPEAGSS